MHEVIAEWEEFCEGTTQRDRSDFNGLLSRQWTDDELNVILRRVPLKDAVIQNLRKVYENSEEAQHLYLRPKRDNAGEPDELLSLIRCFISSQKRYLLKYDVEEETRCWLERPDIEISFVSRDALGEIDPNDDVAPYIRQEEAERRRFRPEARLNIANADSMEYRVISGIKEALYGLAADYYLAWFVLSPLYESEVDYRTYFEFWRKGGSYALTDTQILVASIWSEVDRAARYKTTEHGFERQNPGSKQ